MSEPLVSVVMSTHNYGRFIGETIESLLGQTYQHFEIIVVDDASTDNTLEVIRQFDDERIVLVKRNVCSGSGVFARNDGLAVARGELIAAADADDIYVPERLALQVAFLQAHPEVDMLGGAMIEVDPRRDFVSHPVTRPLYEKPELYRRDLLQGRGVLIHATMMFRRQVLERLHGYKNFPAAGDYEFMLRASRYYRLHNLEDVLMYRRLHPRSVTMVQSPAARHHRQALFMVREYHWVMAELAHASRVGGQGDDE